MVRELGVVKNAKPSIDAVVGSLSAMGASHDKVEGSRIDDDTFGTKLGGNDGRIRGRSIEVGGWQLIVPQHSVTTNGGVASEGPDCCSTCTSEARWRTRRRRTGRSRGWEEPARRRAAAGELSGVG